MFSRKSLFILLILGVFVLSACQAQNDSELTTVTINNSSQVNYAPIYFAQSEGYFEEFGIELEVVTFTRVTEDWPASLTDRCPLLLFFRKRFMAGLRYPRAWSMGCRWGPAGS